MTPEDALQALSGHLPQTVLLLGSGAWELGIQLAQVHRAQETVGSLDAATARRLREEAQYTPPHPPLVYLVRLDGATPAAQNMLLKLLEEPPSWTRFILAADAEPLKTVVSRCQVLTVGAVASREEEDSRVRGQVMTVIKAARNGSQQLLGQAVKGWSPEHGRVLQSWALEAAAGRWVRFDAGFAPGVTQGQALALLTVLDRYAGSKLAPLVALPGVFRTQ